MLLSIVFEPWHRDLVFLLVAREEAVGPRALPRGALLVSRSYRCGELAQMRRLDHKHRDATRLGEAAAGGGDGPVCAPAVKSGADCGLVHEKGR